jgi:hypothetical protein
LPLLDLYLSELFPTPNSIVFAEDAAFMDGDRMSINAGRFSDSISCGEIPRIFLGYAMLNSLDIDSEGVGDF